MFSSSNEIRRIALVILGIGSIGLTACSATAPMAEAPESAVAPDESSVISEPRVSDYDPALTGIEVNVGPYSSFGVPAYLDDYVLFNLESALANGIPCESDEDARYTDYTNSIYTETVRYMNPAGFAAFREDGDSCAWVGFAKSPGTLSFTFVNRLSEEAALEWAFEALDGTTLDEELAANMNCSSIAPEGIPPYDFCQTVSMAATVEANLYVEDGTTDLARTAALLRAFTDFKASSQGG